MAPPIRSEFHTHQLNPAGLTITAQVRAGFSDLLDLIDHALPGPTRERSIVVTKLQEACMFAIRGIAIDQGKQVAGVPTDR